MMLFVWCAPTRAQNEEKPTAVTILAQLKALYKVDDITASELTDCLKDGADAGWLIPEDDGVYFLKEPVQTPDRPHAGMKDDDAADATEAAADVETAPAAMDAPADA